MVQVYGGSPVVDGQQSLQFGCECLSVVQDIEGCHIEGHIVFRRSTDGNLVAARQINCLVPSVLFEDGVLGDGFIGVSILEDFIGDVHERMTHQKWPILECGFLGDRSLSEIVDHFSQILEVFNPNPYLGGQKKASYRYINCDHRVAEKMSSYAKKINLKRVRAISSQKCCPDECVQKFSHVDNLIVRQRYYLKKFDEQWKYRISIGGQMHYVGNN